MAVFQMLPEVIRAEELFALIAFAKLVDVVEVVDSQFPIHGTIRKLDTAVSAHVMARRSARRRLWYLVGVGVLRNGGARVEGGGIVSIQGGA